MTPDPIDAIPQLAERVSRASGREQEPDSVEAAHAYARFTAVFAAHQTSVRTPSTTRRTARRFPGMGWTVLGSAVLVALVLFAREHTTKPIQATTHVYRAERGIQRTITLADGSTMILAPSTTARVEPGQIVIDGEAYFSVVPHPDRPFLVRTKDAQVNVLGTSFAVRRYASDRASQVAVVTGRVAVHTIANAPARSHDAILGARMIALVSDSIVDVRSVYSLDAYVGWKDGQLVFEQMPLARVVQELGRIYGVEIQIPDSLLGSEVVTTTVSTRQQTLTDALSMLAPVVNARVMQQGKTFVFVRGKVSTPVRGARPYPQPEMQYGK